MEPKVALGIALALALALPYVTVALVRSGRFGYAAVGGLFVGALLLVVLADLRGDDAEHPSDEDTG